MKTHVLTVSKKFPGYHPRKGEMTEFVTKILANEKIHTIRTNYDFWKKRIDEVNYDKAILSARQWIDRPYHKPGQFTFGAFTKENGIGVQKLQLTPLGWFIDDIESDVTTEELAKNDGLLLPDFKAWFKKVTIDTPPMAIIHFTAFRYENNKNSDHFKISQ